MRRSTCRIAATRHAQVEQDDMCAPRARAGQSRMKIAEGMTCAPVGNAAACVSVRPVHLRRHAPQVCAHSSPRAHAARTTATGETEFFERGWLCLARCDRGFKCLRTFGSSFGSKKLRPRSKNSV